MKILLALLFLSLCCFGCSSTDMNPASGSNGVPVGTLKGTVSLIDTVSQHVVDKSGVLVELLGTSYSAITDTGGLWSIPNLPSRTYNIKYSKPGYDPYKVQVAFLGGATVWLDSVELFHKLSFSTVLDAVILPPPDSIDTLGKSHYGVGYIYAHFSKNTPLHVYLGTMIIAGPRPDITIEDESSYRVALLNTSQTGYFTVKTNPDSSNDISIPIYNGEAYYGTLLVPSLQKSFSKGDTIYVRSYPYITSIPCIATIGVFAVDAKYYIDPENRKRVFYGVGEASNVLSVVVK